MSQAMLQEAVTVSEKCAFFSRVPSKCCRLSELALGLEIQERQELADVMTKEGYTGRMVAKAIKIAPANVAGADQIIDTLIVVLGCSETIAQLTAIGYFEAIAKQARKLWASGSHRSDKAGQLCDHLRWIFGDSYALERLVRCVEPHRPQLTKSLAAA